MVQCYSAGDSNVSSHEGTLAPPGECNWIYASFGPLESTTQTANGLFQPFLHSLRHKVPILYNGRPYPPELPFPTGDLDSHVTHDALSPCEPTTETAPQSVQPCLHRSPQSAPVWFACFALKIVNSHVGVWTSCNIWFIGPTRVRNANGNLIVSAVFAGLASVTDWQRDRQTDKPRYSVRGGVIMRNCEGYGKATQSFHVNTNIFATVKSLSVRSKHLTKYLV